MKARTDKDIEVLIDNSTFPNPAHKSGLRETLFKPTRAPGLDEMDTVAGGKTVLEPEEWICWSAAEENKP